jgi:hypothetical protein
MGGQHADPRDAGGGDGRPTGDGQPERVGAGGADQLPFLEGSDAPIELEDPPLLGHLLGAGVLAERRHQHPVERLELAFVDGSELSHGLTV